MVAPEVTKAASATAGRALVLKVDTEALPTYLSDTMFKAYPTSS